MPRMVITQSIQTHLTVLDVVFERMLLDASVISATDTGATLELGTSTMILTGTDLEFGAPGSGPTLIGGTLDAMHYSYRAGYDIFFSDLFLDAGALAAAARAESNGSDIGALEALLYPLDWDITGNSTTEVFTDSAVSHDNVPISYSGNNVIDVEYGNDQVAAGAGNDWVYAGMGQDILWGGTGLDRLFGQSGQDTLFGDAGRDRLFGGRGQDVLSGGDGNDRLNGGGGDDQMSGDAGRDVFVIRDIAGWDQDRILDFDPLEDTIRLRTDAEVQYQDGAGGLLIRFGGQSVLLDNVALGDLDPGSVQIVPL